MASNFYPYLWYIHLKKIENIQYEGYIPYFELSLSGFNSGKDVAYVNLPMLNMYLDNEEYKALYDFYIKLLAYIRYSMMNNRLSLSRSDKNYIISKWKYKSRYIKDSMYVFFACLRNTFSSYMVYRKNNMFYIILDYNKDKNILDIMEEIIDNFLPIGIECKYFFNNFLFLDIEEFSFYERWISLWNMK